MNLFTKGKLWRIWFFMLTSRSSELLTSLLFFVCDFERVTWILFFQLFQPNNYWFLMQIMIWGWKWHSTKEITINQPKYYYCCDLGASKLTQEVTWSPVAGPQRCFPIARYETPLNDSIASKFKSSTAMQQKSPSLNYKRACKKQSSIHICTRNNKWEFKKKTKTNCGYRKIQCKHLI